MSVQRLAMQCAFLWLAFGLPGVLATTLEPPCPGDRLLSCQLKRGWSISASQVEALEDELSDLRKLVSVDDLKHTHAELQHQRIALQLADEKAHEKVEHTLRLQAAKTTRIEDKRPMKFAFSSPRKLEAKRSRLRWLELRYLALILLLWSRVQVRNGKLQACFELRVRKTF